MAWTCGWGWSIISMTIYLLLVRWYAPPVTWKWLRSRIALYQIATAVLFGMSTELQAGILWAVPAVILYLVVRPSVNTTLLILPPAALRIVEPTYGAWWGTASFGSVALLWLIIVTWFIDDAHQR